MVANLTERVTRMSATVLRVPTDAPTSQIIDRLTQVTGAGEQWLRAGARNAPADPFQARAVHAARVLTSAAPQRTQAVVDFLAADHALSPEQRMVQPADHSPAPFRAVS